MGRPRKKSPKKVLDNLAYFPGVKPEREAAPQSPDWNELRAEWNCCLAVTEGCTPAGCFDLDSEGVVTAYDPPEGESGYYVGLNFFSDVAPFVRDFDYEEFVDSGFVKVFKFDGWQVTFLRIMPPGNALAICKRIGGGQ
jgi:hypothetical protein